ncbi:hypothetical protein HCN44_002244 [Aphidius gifuensis]|uniref:Uncharacterized protein n=1 Tax=Aphidius gifuensis TaxID=684658 RepID=A0A834XZS1_APHGI|nr:uncharacterized protein LOC122860630 [Aphidius gifuensis]KAF7996598.1 hypothetical protein HCN44_002244 [Aphidius gifuensis]
MPSGVVFLVCIPTLSHEHQLIFGSPVKTSKKNDKPSKLRGTKVDLRLKETKNRNQHLITIGDNSEDDEDDDYADADNEPDDIEVDAETFEAKRRRRIASSSVGKRTTNKSPVFVPMETVLDELLKKLQVEHVVWNKDKANMYYEVIFPVPAGDPCENCLHCLTEMGIGTRMNSVVSVIPTQCTYSSMQNKVPLSIKAQNLQRKKDAEVRNNAWEAFVDSIRSKLTVKQVVDGVRSGGDLTFDYIMLVLTADCLAGLGLIENSATNVVAAMLVSPLMGPVMSLTFGMIIADRELIGIGFKSLSIGIIISIIFGFLFGLIIGSTEMPWGWNDWPTDEMKGRGNYRSLWMGVLWALPSGVGVAVALLQGSNGPLIGVAISASLLPPVVNCGLFWALACIWIVRKKIKMPHIKGESFNDLNTSYVYVYSKSLPIEFVCNGAISACLTFVNVICIFISAIIVLKIKEVAAPYTSTPELRRFWQHDIRMVRDKNTSTRDNSSVNSSFYDDMSKTRQRALGRKLNEAVREAINDETFREVKRLSYGQHGPDDISPRLGLGPSDLVVADNNSRINEASGLATTSDGISSIVPRQNNDNNNNIPSVENTSEDLAALDRLITYLLGQPNSNLDNWHRSRRASIRGYRQLRPNVIDTTGTGGSSSNNINIGTTPL